MRAKCLYIYNSPSDMWNSCWRISVIIDIDMMDRLVQLANDYGLVAMGVAPAIDEVRQVYDWAESVVVGAVSYLGPETDCVDNAHSGLVARVARGADYHNVLRDKLTRLAEVLKSEGARAEVCVDTCPLPERKLAVLAGIAWRGKSGNVFVEGCGSFVALGEIITDLKLPACEPLDVDRCAACDRCMRACPTGAIIAPHTINQERCLSRVNQISGVVPVEFRRLMANRIYGCDVCQEVCLQNAGIRPVSPEFAEAMPPGAHPDPLSLITLSSREFKQELKRSSIGWIGRTRIRRNAAIAAGNLKYQAAVPALREMLKDENPILRVTSAWALGEIGSSDAVSALKAAQANEKDLSVIEEIRTALSKWQEDL